MSRHHHDHAFTVPVPRQGARANLPRERHPSTLAHVEPATYPEAETARYLGVARSTLRHWRLSGDGPAYLKLGRMVRYRRRDLDAWLDARTLNPIA